MKCEAKPIKKGENNESGPSGNKRKCDTILFGKEKINIVGLKGNKRMRYDKLNEKGSNNPDKSRKMEQKYAKTDSEQSDSSEN